MRRRTLCTEITLSDTCRDATSHSFQSKEWNVQCKEFFVGARPRFWMENICLILTYYGEYESIETQSLKYLKLKSLFYTFSSFKNQVKINTVRLFIYNLKDVLFSYYLMLNSRTKSPDGIIKCCRAQAVYSTANNSDVRFLERLFAKYIFHMWIYFRIRFLRLKTEYEWSNIHRCIPEYSYLKAIFGTA